MNAPARMRVRVVRPGRFHNSEDVAPQPAAAPAAQPVPMVEPHEREERQAEGAPVSDDVSDLALVALVRCLGAGMFFLLSLRREPCLPRRSHWNFYDGPRRAKRAGEQHLGVSVWRLERDRLGARFEGYGAPDELFVAPGVHGPRRTPPRG